MLSRRRVKEEDKFSAKFLEEGAASLAKLDTEAESVYLKVVAAEGDGLSW
jgi:hypothetical protein